MSVTFKVEGLDKLAKKLDSIGDLKFLKAIMRAAGETIKKHIAKYPPASSANSPQGPGTSYYVRGQGTHYERVGGGESVYKTSETLGRSWTTAVKDNGLTVEVGTKVSYARYVQDRDKQTWFHEARGWTTAQTVIEEDGEKITKQVKEEIEKKLAA
jgi:hypothetical protein